MVTTGRSPITATITVATTGSAGAGGQGGFGGVGGQGGEGGTEPSNLTVRAIYPNEQPVADVTVAVNAATGQVLSTAVTGPSGTVDVLVPEDGIVVVYPPSSGSSASAQAYVSPPLGGTLTAGLTGSVPSLDETDYTVTMTGYPASTAELRLITCLAGRSVAANASGTTIETFDDNACLTRPISSNTIIATAYDASDNPVAWGRKDVPTNPGNTVTVDLLVDQVGMQTVTATMAPLGDSVTIVQGVLNAAVGSNLVLPLQILETIQDPMPSAEWQLELPDTPLGIGSLLTTHFNDAGNVRLVQLSKRFQMAPTSFSFDPNGVIAVRPNAPDMTDPVHPVISWTSDAGDHGDYMLIALRTRIGTDDFFFTIFAPPDHPVQFQLFDVPSSVAHFDLTVGGGPVEWKGRVGYLLDPNTSGWADSYLFVPPAAGVDIEQVLTAGIIP